MLELEPEMSYSSAKLGRDEVGREEVLSAGIESENALLEAVTRSAALQTVVADWVSKYFRSGRVGRGRVNHVFPYVFCLLCICVCPKI